MVLQRASVVYSRAQTGAPQWTSFAHEKFSERLSELDIEGCVDERIYGWGSVAKPECHVSWTQQVSSSL